MPHATSDGIRVYYEIHGDEGPALVLLHGSGANHGCWWQQIPHFRDRFRVVTIDFPGYGLSDSEAETFNVQEFPPTVVAVLDHAGIDRAILVGQSMGGVPALAVAVNHPDRVVSAVMAHSLGGISDEEIASAGRADREEANTKYTMLQRLWTDGVVESQPEKVFLYTQMGTFNEANFYRVKNAEHGVATLQQVRDAIASGVDITFLRGTKDRITGSRSYDRLSEFLPEANIEIAEGAGHLSYWESPELFNSTLDRILDRVLQTA